MRWVQINSPIIKGIYVNDGYSGGSRQRCYFAFADAENYYDCIDDMPEELESYISIDDSSCVISLSNDVGEDVYMTITAIIAEHDGHKIVKRRGFYV